MVSSAKVKASISKILGLLLKYINGMIRIQCGPNSERLNIRRVAPFFTNIKHYRSPLSINSYTIINMWVSFHTNHHFEFTFLPFQVFSCTDPPFVGASDIGQDLEYFLRVHTTHLFLSSTWNLTFHLEPINQIQCHECGILFMPITESTN